MLSVAPSRGALAGFRARSSFPHRALGPAMWQVAMVSVLRSFLHRNPHLPDARSTCRAQVDASTCRISSREPRCLVCADKVNLTGVARRQHPLHCCRPSRHREGRQWVVQRRPEVGGQAQQCDAEQTAKPTKSAVGRMAAVHRRPHSGQGRPRRPVVPITETGRSIRSAVQRLTLRGPCEAAKPPGTVPLEGRVGFICE